jgi:hypothetical protein
MTLRLALAAEQKIFYPGHGNLLTLQVAVNPGATFTQHFTWITIPILIFLEACSYLFYDYCNIDGRLLVSGFISVTYTG